MRSSDSSSPLSKQGKHRRKWGGLLGSKPKASQPRVEDTGPRLPLPPTISKETMVRDKKCSCDSWNTVGTNLVAEFSTELLKGL